MSPTDIDSITVWVFLNKIDIGYQRRSSIAAFQQIMTENEILRKASINGLTKGIHIVDALADK